MNTQQLMQIRKKYPSQQIIRLTLKYIDRLISKLVLLLMQSDLALLLTGNIIIITIKIEQTVQV